jgi:hypothetical protein
MALPDALPDATVPAVRRFPLPDLHRADALPPAQPALDASAAVHPDEAEDVAHPAPAVARCAEKSVVPALVVPAQAAELRPAQAAEAKAPYRPGVAPSAA